MRKVLVVMFCLASVLAASLFAGSVCGMANAAMITDIDLTKFNFDVVNYSIGPDNPGTNPSYPHKGVGGNATASGTSNGVGWSIGPTNIYSGRTRTDGSFAFRALPGIRTDNIHPGIDFTITFDQKIDTLLVALSNDGQTQTDSINFGLVPVDYRGVHLVNGTQFVLNNRYGGLALFEGIDSFTITHVNNNGIRDGFDLAFYVVSTEPESPSQPVPEPATMLLMGTGLAGLAAGRYRRRNGKASR